MRRSIVWFRNDLRLHDNEALVDALGHNDEVLPLYVVDPRIFSGKTNYGFPKTGQYRMQFIIESLIDLRVNLRNLGSDLYIRYGFPEDVIPELAREAKTSYIYCNRERTQEEVLVQDRLEQGLWVIGQEMRYYRGKMLYYTADLPFPITHCPDTFTTFKKEVERFVPIRSPLSAPVNMAPVTLDIESGELPRDHDYGFEMVSGTMLKGGESSALAELNYYLWDSNCIASYKETRNGLLGRDYSSKFSAHLSQGTLSPKLIYFEVQKYEKEVQKNKSTYWLIFELLWRDFFRFMAKKHGNLIFTLGGIKQSLPIHLFDNETLFNKWKEGKTGIPFIDANMRELNSTGFMSNRGRQNVASFLVKDMRINWLWGAEYFESMLVDYDPCSNYGNWNYIAGVGSDPREDRYFNIPSQVKKYDPEGIYMRNWLPELAEAPISYLINPYEIPLEYRNYDYPSPCIDIKTW